MKKSKLPKPHTKAELLGAVKAALDALEQIEGNRIESPDRGKGEEWQGPFDHACVTLLDLEIALGRRREK